MSADEELEDASGWLVTYWTCPHCQDVHELEGHVSDEVVVCPSCHQKSRIGHVG